MKKLLNKFIKDDKVFGKYNIIDFLLVVILVVCIAVGAVSLLSRTVFNVEEGNEETLVMKFYTEEVSDFVVKKLKAGSKLLDEDKKIELGKAVEIEINDSISYGGINNGEYEFASKTGYKSAIITAEVDGEKNELGAIIDGAQYGVGHSMTLRVGDAKIYLRVYDIGIKKEIEESEKLVADKKKPILMSFEANDVNNVAVSSLEAGDVLYDVTSSVELGKIVSFDVSDAKVFVETDDGRLVTSSKEGHSSVKIVAEVSGVLTESGVASVGNKDYYLAKDIYLRVGNAVVGYALVTDIKLK